MNSSLLLLSVALSSSLSLSGCSPRSKRAWSGHEPLNLILMLAFSEDEAVPTGLGLGPAAAIAIEDARAKFLQDRPVNWTVIGTRCSPKYSVHELITVLRGSSIVYHGIVGPQCDDVCATVGFIAATYDIVEVAYGCQDSAFSDSSLYPTMVRTGSSLDLLLPMLLLKLVDTLTIDDLVIIWTKGSTSESKIAFAVESAIQNAGSTIDDNFRATTSYFAREEHYDTDEMMHSMKQMLRKLKPTYKNYLILTEPHLVYDILLQANEIEMLNGDYVFMSSMAVSEKNMQSVYQQHRSSNLRSARHSSVDGRLANGVIFLNYLMPNTTEFVSFVKKVTNGVSYYSNVPQLKKFWQSDTEEQLLLDNNAALLYDAVALWAKGAKSCIDKDLPVTGRNMVKALRKTSVQGITGIVQIDDSGERMLNFEISVMQSEKLVRVGEYYPKEDSLNLHEDNFNKIVWMGGKKNVVAMRPKMNKTHTIIWIVCVFVAMVILVIVLFLALRYLRLHLAIRSLNNKFIKYQEIVFCSKSPKDKTGDSGSMGSRTPSGRESKSFETFVVNDCIAVGYYKEKKIVIKTTNRVKVDTRNKLIVTELLHIQKIHHHNVNPYIGVCVESPNICVCMAYCVKGSLWDIISQRLIPMTWDFRISIALDVAKGMNYLHGSPLRTHGRLKSTNCVIDGRWSCKVTDYGLPNFRTGQGHFNQDVEEDNEANLWTAPELLRLRPNKRPLAGTKTGDYYSYGIVLHEICFQNKPFGSFYEDLGSTYIVDLVRAEKHDSHFRPLEEREMTEMPGDTGKYSPKWFELMKLCWLEHPLERLSFRQIVKYLSDINEKKQIRAIDSMVQMLETYTTRLENVVYERHQQVVEEKRKADSLLYNILPRIVADQLKEGQRVLPEKFEAVTIFLSDIVKFTPLAAESTPNEVVAFLGLLYQNFDDTIDRHGVYKVETIGDAYVVAGGLPVRNGNLHVIQIAIFSLEILKLILNFTIPHRPNRKLEIRIGLHTGPVLAGVVGVKMPRYCLFGQTLATANYMEVTAPVNSVHASNMTGTLLMENGGFVMSDFKALSYEDKEDVMTYRIRGYTRNAFR